jgi:hypothetical protein
MFAASLLLIWYLYDFYGRTRPRQPEPSLGRIIPLNNHGTVVFLTKGEDNLLIWIFYSQCVFGSLTGIFFMNEVGRRRG